MIGTAKASTDPEVEVAAAYFSGLTPQANLTVIEADQVPKSYVFGWHMAANTTGKTEPLGQRILEVPDNLEQFESRDGRARFTAYVPPGEHSERAAPRHRGRGRQDTSLCALSWPRTQRARPISRACSSVAQLHRPPTLRLQERCSGGHEQCPDAANTRKP